MTVIPTPSTSSGPTNSARLSGSTATHELKHETEHEFGKIAENIVPIDHEGSSEEDLAVPVNILAASQAPVTSSSGIKKPLTKYQMLTKRLMRPRWLRQYFLDGQLVRELKPRKVMPEELFLDLIIVANVAVLGHELRESNLGWEDVEKFILLFGVIWSSWRNFAFLWNLFSSHSDIFEKLFVCLEMFSLCGVGISAHAIFSEAKNYGFALSTCSLLIPAIAHILFSVREPIMKQSNNIMNVGVFSGLVNVACALIYLIAIPIPTKGNRIALVSVGWIGFVCNVFGQPLANMVYRHLHRNRTSALHVAVNIETIVEKNALLTLIVLGEALLAILFEGADIIKEAVSLTRLYFSAFLGVVISYAYMTLYFNVDNLILKGGLHSIRYKPIRGHVWSITHLFHQMGLIFTATGIGQALRTVALQKGSESTVGEKLGTLVRAGAEKGPLPRTEFTSSHSWLFAGGFAIVLLSSALLGGLHKRGPRAATKWFRLPTRVAVTLVVTIGLPLWPGLSTIAFESIFAGVLVVIVLVEVILVEMDRMGWWKNEGATTTVSQYSTDDLGNSSEDDFFHDLDFDNEDEFTDDATMRKRRARRVQWRKNAQRQPVNILPSFEIPENRGNGQQKMVRFEPTETEADGDQKDGKSNEHKHDYDENETLSGGPKRGHSRSVSIAVPSGTDPVNNTVGAATGSLHRRAVSMFPADILEHLHRDDHDLEAGAGRMQRTRTRVIRNVGGQRLRFETLCQGDKGAASCTINH
eukprot:Plantae.Rhodophyta-Hildenbrandia_rubra.ctg13016.p1 GENE.Plantae.Rhodophyta-Hildenbrandia_rubra.ctg13016~~Plantae.Rhodophyta-Hildenbrandia_rubra.ctg13016.p1  ORF type:complete len:753 (+),score=123.31 Plantae.Rhodophyta-Hildenbrandia_rubra.ctg13016:4625-6883(+)